METTGAKALEEFADSIKNDPDKEYNMPKDGTVHELTSNAILFLQQLLDFQETAGAMLASQVLGDTYNIPLDPRERVSGSVLKDKERQVIKDKFKGFNDGLEELCKIQKVWAIPDKEQRDAIRHAQKKLISDAYKAFLHRCANMPFTKNPEKYHKYTPELVEDMIDKLFDTSA
ncbi:hypothetical protein PGIGA_G00041160 [Pangasianodon gigas]|uniref:Uncharacterized protein n=1 Tax=Pangasianodon gigas TaxID=30993 RepID=A0ACC5X079_PANGG|nr:hypothetical protein [Pangasianodon gigas]